MESLTRFIANLVAEGAKTPKEASELFEGVVLAAKYDNGVKASLHYSFHMLSEAMGPYFNGGVLSFLQAYLGKKGLDWKKGKEGNKFQAKLSFAGSINDAVLAELVRLFHDSDRYPRQKERHLQRDQSPAAQKAYYDAYAVFVAETIGDDGTDKSCNTDAYDLWAMSERGYMNVARYIEDGRIGNRADQATMELYYLHRWELAGKYKYIIQDLMDILQLMGASPKRSWLSQLMSASPFLSTWVKAQQAADGQQEIIIKWIKQLALAGVVGPFVARKLAMVSANLDLFVRLRLADMLDSNEQAKRTQAPARGADVRALVDAFRGSNALVRPILRDADGPGGGVGNVEAYLRTHDRVLTAAAWQRLLESKNFTITMHGLEVVEHGEIAAALKVKPGDTIVAVKLPDQAAAGADLDELSSRDLRAYGMTLRPKVPNFRNCTSMKEMKKAIKGHFERKQLNTAVDAADDPAALAYREKSLIGVLYDAAGRSGLSIAPRAGITVTVAHLLSLLSISTALKQNQTVSLKVYNQTFPVRALDGEVAVQRAQRTQTNKKKRMAKGRRPEDGGDGSPHEVWDANANLRDHPDNIINMNLLAESAKSKAKKMYAKAHAASAGASKAQTNTKWPARSRLRSVRHDLPFSKSAGYGRHLSRQRRDEANRLLAEQVACLMKEVAVNEDGTNAGGTGTGGGGAAALGASTGKKPADWSSEDKAMQQTLIARQTACLAVLDELVKRTDDSATVIWHTTSPGERNESAVYLIEQHDGEAARLADETELALENLSRSSTALQRHFKDATSRAAGDAADAATSDGDDDGDSDGDGSIHGSDDSDDSLDDGQAIVGTTVAHLGSLSSEDASGDDDGDDNGDDNGGAKRAAGGVSSRTNRISKSYSRTTRHIRKSNDRTDEGRDNGGPAYDDNGGNAAKQSAKGSGESKCSGKSNGKGKSRTGSRTGNRGVNGDPA